MTTSPNTRFAFPVSARNRALWSITVVCLLTFLVACVNRLATGADLLIQQDTTPRLTIIAPEQVALGVPIALELRLSNSSTVAGYEATLLWDQMAAEFGGVWDEDNDLAKAGYSTQSLSLPELPGGLAFGLYSCTTNGCLGQSQVRSLTPLGNDLYLGTIRLIPLVEGPLTLWLDAAKFVDRNGHSLPVAVASTPLIIQVGDRDQGNARESNQPAVPPALWSLAPHVTAAQPVTVDPESADLTADATVGYSDLIEIALEWQLTRLSGAPCAGPNSRDINRDGCVDVADLQLLAANYFGAMDVPVNAAAVLATWVVNSTGDESDKNIGNGICATAVDTCTLRAAIQEANVSTGADTITFNIPGSGLHTIQLTRRMTTITDLSGGITIDGYTQPGATPNTDPVISNATILIEVAGNGAADFDGFVFTSGNHTLQGMAFYNFRRPIWIFGNQADNNTITGMFIGTNAAGTFVAPNEELLAHGIHIEQDSGGNRIGGTTPGERNVISGNARHGIGIWHNKSDNNLIVNNIIGLAPDGSSELPNRKHGMDLNFGSSENVVGGTGLYEHNVMSGNDDSGIEVSHTTETTNNLIIGNYVGTNITGTVAYTWTMNHGRGIMLEDGVTGNTVAENVVGNNFAGGIELRLAHTVANLIRDNRVGISLDGTPIGNPRFGIMVEGNNNRIGPGNVIAYNLFAGVKIFEADADGNLITQNSFFGNGTQSIDLAPSGVNINDVGDGDSGPNQQLNTPGLTVAYPTWVGGTACANCTIEIYRATGAAGTFGEGMTFLAAGVTDFLGNFAVAVPPLTPGQVVTALAIDAADNSSEFSVTIAVQPDCGVGCEQPTPVPTFTPTPTFTVTPTPTPDNCEPPCNTPTATFVPTAPPTPTFVPTAPATPTPMLLAFDYYTRTLTAEWGNADQGGPYTLLWGASAPQDFEVADGAGLIYHQGSYGREALLEQVAPLNADLQVRFKMNSRPQKKRDIYLMARRIDQKNLYRARVGVKPNGQVELHMQRQVNGAWSVFTASAIAPNVDHTAGDYLWARFQVVDTNPTMLQLRVWEDGQPEPTAWHLTVFDSSPVLQSAGTVGMRTFITTDDIYLPVKFFFDDLWITAPGPLVASARAWQPDSPTRSFYADELMAEGLDVVFLPLIRNQSSE